MIRNRSKWLVLVFSFVTLVFFVQIMLRCSYEQLTLYVQNESSSDTLYIDVCGYLEDITSCEQGVVVQKLVPYKVPSRLSSSYSKFYIVQNHSGAEKSVVANTFFVKWIVVNIYDDKVVCSTHYIPPLLQ